MFRILFLCTGNGGRSQMAAAFADQWASEEMDIFSGGDSRMAVDPLAPAVMEEIGLNISDQLDYSINDLQSAHFDLVVTLCNHANEICPTLPGSPARLHWPLTDPSRGTAPSEQKRAEIFRDTRDEIQQRIEGLFQYGFLDSIRQIRLTLGSLIDNLTDGVMAHDLDRRIFFFNRAAQNITGFSYDEVMGQDCHAVFESRFCGGDCSFCEDKSHFTLPRLRYPRSFTRKTGEKRELEMSVVNIQTANDGMKGVLVIFRDITETVHLKRRLDESRGFCGIVGRHISMQKVFESVRELADVHVPILIQGESGTGKEMVATALHQLSKRSSGPFVPVNCGALPEGTLESELFGHVKGAFTGAIHDRKGRFALAEGGAIFLDEIGEISPAMQVKLLRVIQERWFVPVGGERSVSADVRIICATNRDLKLLTQQGLFREDLYYRLAVVPVHLPTLRERKGDIPLLVEHFLDKFSTDTGKRVQDISPMALEHLMNYSWPGNVRELGNAVQYAMIKSQQGTIDFQHLPPEILESDAPSSIHRPGRKPKLLAESVADALRRAGGNKAQAARLLHVSRTTLYRYLGAQEVSNNT